MDEKEGILSFTLYKIEKGREKICKCNPPHYILDEVNRIVTCQDCGATIDAFEALMAINRYIDQYTEYQKEAIQKANSYREMANEELHRRFRNKAFKDMDSHYQKGLYPYCPECGRIFDPAKITQWQIMPAQNEGRDEERTNK